MPIGNRLFLTLEEIFLEASAPVRWGIKGTFTETLENMRKFLMIGVTALIFTNTLSGQTEDNNALGNLARINLGPHGLDLSYELSISNRFIWENSFGIGMGSNAFGSSTGFVFDFGQPVPYLKSELKYIYNRERRINKGKNSANNSGNYIGIQPKYSFGNQTSAELNQTLLTEVHWGLQRSVGRDFLFDAHIGLGYLKDFDTKGGGVSPTLGVRFGYKIF